MVILYLFLAVDRDAPLEALLATAFVTAIDFMAINNSQPVSPHWLKHFVANQTFIHLAEDISQARNIHNLGNIPYLICAGHIVPEKAAETRLGPELIKRVKTGKPTKP